MDRSIREAIARKMVTYREDVVDFVRAIVSLPTENPPGLCYKECAKLVRQKLDEIGLDSTLLKIPMARPLTIGNGKYPRYIILAHHGRGKRTIYFHGHYDVVPASSEAQFKASVKAGKVFGRGSSDMKGGLAAMIYAIKAIKEIDFELDGKIALVIVPDEETGGLYGSQELVKRGLLGKDGIYALMAEPTGGVIWNANRGAISLRITVMGRPAHVGLHYEGINAFEQVLIVANELIKLKDEIKLKSTNFHIEPEPAKYSILMLGGRVEGGTNFNTVPAECSLTVDRRFNPEEDLKEEKQKLFALFEELRRRGIRMKVSVLQEGESCGVSEDTPLAQALSNSIREVTGKSPCFEMCPGLLEIRFYAKRGIPAFAYGPGELSVSHGPKEFVRIKNILECGTIFAMTAVRLLTNTATQAL
jgi:acetylornithine deacetylase/succinyl-diaminopimelate desuccinylase family protein